MDKEPIAVGDTVFTRRLNNTHKKHIVTQVIANTGMLILNGTNDRHMSSINTSRLAFRDGAWYETI